MKTSSQRRKRARNTSKSAYVIPVEPHIDRVTRIDPSLRVHITYLLYYSLVSGAVIGSRTTMKIKRGYYTDSANYLAESSKVEPTLNR